MGLFGKLNEMRMKDPVAGTAKVAAIDFPHGNLPNDGRPYTRLECVATAPGIDPVVFEYKGSVDRGKVPLRGDELPIQIDRLDPQRVEIQWNEVASRRLGARDQHRADRERAAKMAAQMRDHDGTDHGPPPRHDPYFETDAATVRANAEAAQARRAQRIAESKANKHPSHTDPEGQEQRLQQLERLAALHASGALTDAEFAAEKAKLLAS